MNVYDIGDIVRLAGVFTNQGGTPVDPGTVTVKVKNPLGVTSSYVYLSQVEVVKLQTGSYYADVSPTIQGVWSYKWEGTTPNKGAGEFTFQVRETVFD